MGNQRDLKRREAWCIGRVATATGREAQPEPGNWPDGWLRDASGRSPVEVVTGHQRRAGEDPSRGSPSARALRQAEREAKALGQPAVFGTHHEQGFAIPLDGRSALPLRQEPVDPTAWIEDAVLQKAGKAYANAKNVVLVVDFNWMPLYEFELPELATRLKAAGVTFKEVWVVTEFDPVQQVW